MECPVLKTDDGRYRLYYKAGRHGSPEYRGNPPVDGETRSSFGCYAESDGGITWTRPSVGLFEVAGNRDNNVILPPEIGNNCAGDFSPFEDTRPGVPADQRYKGISGMTGRVSALPGLSHLFGLMERAEALTRVYIPTPLLPLMCFRVQPTWRIH